MALQLQITTRGIDKSASLEERIEQKAEKLTQFIDNIISCQVTLESIQKNKHKGNLHSVHIKILVPNKEFNVSHSADESIHIAIKDAFDKMRRQLEDYNNQLHGEIKPHREILRGTIIRLFEGFGFIKGIDGQEYYFHANNLTHHKFSNLDIDMPVHFLPAMGDEGLQAHRVSAQKDD
ncbi:MAG: hypothetical protein A3F17_03980 [Gammaproteobacteria bacterium RIFCSPHIGHO2_12_FULL_41_15]|nr:MAG: hypothetical protein A3F17_03980 [Gammaproteobacteria bacterium RIFCSPHIGHO2_12_FULL_41_15]